MTNGTKDAIVVGVDDDDRAVAALSWAAHQAVVADRPLRLVHAQLLPGALVLASGIVDAWTGVEPARWSARVLDGAVALLRQLAPGVPVSVCEAMGSPARLLLAEAERASMLVLGSHGAGLVSDLFVGTVCGAVAGRASCPVVTVNGRPAWPDAPIVVGIDAAATAAHALAFAFGLAQRRRAPLRLHHVRRTRTRMSSIHPACDPRYGLDQHRSRFPEVVYSLSESRGAPAAELTDAAVDAQLLVIGSRGRGLAAEVLRRSVGHGLVRRPPCPLAIVPA